MRLPALLSLAWAILGSATHAAPAIPAASVRPPALRPNVVFLFTDDQRADTLRILGNRHIQTPNLDRLVRDGTTFTQAHIMGGLQGAVCVPSRAMMLSGRSLFRVRENLRDTPTWPRQLRAAGWDTFMTGKWHNTPATVPASFASGNAVFLGGMTDQNRIKVRDLAPDGTFLPERIVEQPSSELFTDAAVRFLEKRRPPSGNPNTNPFVLYVAFTSPHDPRTPPDAYLRRYRPDRLPLPPNFLPEHPFDNGELVIRDEKLLPHPLDPASVRAEIAAYYGMITHVDAQIGRILDALDATGEADRTIIVYAGDNGLALGSHGLLGKQNLYEHSTRVPLVIAGPGVARNHRTDALVQLLDLPATLCEMAGVPAPEGHEGRSLGPLLRRETRTGRDAHFSAYRDIQRAVTDGRWKLIVYPRTGRAQLFDLRRDPHERRDLSGEPRHASQRVRLTALLAREQAAFGDPLTTAR